MGVNELASRWGAEWIESGEPLYNVYDCSECAYELRETARTSWHSSEEPPSAEDADSQGNVVMQWENGYIEIGEYDWVAPPSVLHWARIRDVVLLPPEG